MDTAECAHPDGKERELSAQPEPQQAQEPQKIYTSVNETLAYAMVDGLYTITLEKQDDIRRLPPPLHNGRKRAAAIRHHMRWLIARSTPFGLLGTACVEPKGGKLLPARNDGKSRRAVYVQLHWVMLKPVHREYQYPMLRMDLITYTFRKGHSYAQPLLRISRHALMRLYRRLGTTSHDLVMQELNQLSTYHAHLYMLLNHAVPRADQVWILRSRNGVFLVCRDEDDASVMVAKTWLSHRRLEGSALARKLAALPQGCRDPLILKDMPTLPMVSLHELLQRSPAATPEELPRLVHQALCACYRPGRAMPAAFSIVPVPAAPIVIRGATPHPPFPLSLLLPGTLRLHDTTS